MSAEPSPEWSAQSSSASEATVLPRFSFVQQSENVIASNTRRAVRSHAMKAVRRQQRQDNVKSFRLKWPEEQTASEDLQLTWPKELSLGFEHQQTRPNPESRIQRGTEEDVLDNHPILDSLEPARIYDTYTSLQTDFQLGQVDTPMDRPSEGVESS